MYSTVGTVELAYGGAICLFRNGHLSYFNDSYFWVTMILLLKGSRFLVF